MFIVYVDSGQFSRVCRGGYVRKEGGAVSIVQDPRDASKYPDRESAEAGKIGHHRDMGGSGFKGRIVSYETSLRSYRRRH